MGTHWPGHVPDALPSIIDKLIIFPGRTTVPITMFIACDEVLSFVLEIVLVGVEVIGTPDVPCTQIFVWRRMVLATRSLVLRVVMALPVRFVWRGLTDIVLVRVHFVLVLFVRLEVLYLLAVSVWIW
jgi:hypothetical protein